MGFKYSLQLLTLALLFSACSPDFLRVHYSRINSAKTAGSPLQLGKDAPGAFVQRWVFTQAGGFRFDPAEIQLSQGVARLVLTRPGSVRFSNLDLSHGWPFLAVFKLIETAGPGNQGQLRYQFSPDQSHWYFHESGRWKSALMNPEQANTAKELQEKLRTFHQEIGDGQLFIRIFLVAPTGVEKVEIQQLEVHGISPKTDGWN
ncbi:MAG TPA: hypothetical protein DCS07_04285 [Bdellovibrionales bacterium]|nr:MAG: hypothetical protein A2Z97_15755 [Bdellovibrionales bacterium GWB1_52_6]OFZ06433.1 MAG: hypothetical protein A2X97_03160 [Bdellovibrionales bacterium GWA1_52_35]HAR41837.1 hypothetical protein [Bdellovibrionales bacterium]HCM40192.1 hypothetical protein [Bdellovibrionales bacterium]